MLYSIYPAETVLHNPYRSPQPQMEPGAPFMPDAPEGEGSSLEQQKLIEIQRDGVLLVVSPGERNLGKIVRLISTDPYDYLNPKYSPGSEIPLY